MNERWLIPSFTASSLIHLGLIPIAALILHAKPIKPVTVPIELIDVPRVEPPKRIEVAPPPPSPPAPKPQPKPGVTTRQNCRRSRFSKPARCRRPATRKRRSKKSPKKSRSRWHRCRKNPARRKVAGMLEPRRSKPKEALRAPVISSAKAISVWSGAAVSKAAVVAKGRAG
jgi:hypothetical protein